MKNWLAVNEKKDSSSPEKYDFYAPDKIMKYEDLVWLAIQESPAISKGQIDLEIQEINKTDAKWQYLPEMHLNYQITTNLTKRNEGSRYVGDSYGETTYETTFSGHYRNPVSTYFNTQAQNELLNTAIIGQREVIAKIIYQIGLCLLNINEYENSLEIIQRKIDETIKKVDYNEIQGKSHPVSHLYAAISGESQKELEMRLKETRMKLISERTKLKGLVGLDLNLALKVDSESIFPFLSAFKPQEMAWESAWDKSETKYFSEQQIKLESANIYLAWSQYFPSVNIGVNESPGKGQSQNSNLPSDQFLHVMLAFPLLDWGHRWRQADIAANRRRQRAINAIEQKRAYQEQWQLQEQNLQLAKATAERYAQSVKSLAQRKEVLTIAVKNGISTPDNLIDMRLRELDVELGSLNAKVSEARSKLTWIDFSSLLGRHFLGDAGMAGN